MNNLFDLLSQAQNGQGIQNLAQLFQLTEEQTRASIEAVLPAFSQGFEKNSNDPQSLNSFLSALSTGDHLNYFENVSNLSQASMTEDGNGILGHLFRSKDMSRQIAQQAASMSGVGETIIKQMLPLIASMLMGGLSKQSSSGGINDMIGMVLGNSFGGSTSSSGNIFSQMAENMFGNLMGGSQAKKTSPQSGLDIFGNLFNSGFEDKSTQQNSVQNPMADIFAEFMKNGRY